jgi:hypothetical protein
MTAYAHNLRSLADQIERDGLAKTVRVQICGRAMTDGDAQSLAAEIDAFVGGRVADLIAQLRYDADRLDRAS